MWYRHSQIFCAGPFVSAVSLAEQLTPHWVPLQLSDGSHRCAGHIEVFYSNRLGVVCDDH